MIYLFPALRDGGLLGSRLTADWEIWLIYAAVAVLAYLFGSISTAVLLSKKLYCYDIREYGSGNAGMTNMGRTFGAKAAVFTALGDVAKALISLLIGYFAIGDRGLYIAGLFCIVGHSFPVFFHFKGGKGVIVSAVTILLIDPVVFLLVLAIWLLMFLSTRIVSAASITAAFFYPLLVALMYRYEGKPRLEYIVCSLFIGLFVIAMHRENIRRMINREEKKVDFAKWKKKREEKKKKAERAAKFADQNEKKDGDDDEA